MALPAEAEAALKQTYRLMPAAVPAGLPDLSLAASLVLLTALPQRSMVGMVQTLSAQCPVLAAAAVGRLTVQTPSPKQATAAMAATPAGEVAAAALASASYQ